MRRHSGSPRPIAHRAKEDQLNNNDLMLTLGGIGLLLGILAVAGSRG